MTERSCLQRQANWRRAAAGRTSSLGLASIARTRPQDASRAGICRRRSSGSSDLRPRRARRRLRCRACLRSATPRRRRRTSHRGQLLGEILFRFRRARGRPCRARAFAAARRDEAHLQDRGVDDRADVQAVLLRDARIGDAQQAVARRVSASRTDRRHCSA